MQVVCTSVQLQPIAPYDVVIHHITEDERQLGFEDLMVEKILIAVGFRLGSRLGRISQ